MRKSKNTFALYQDEKSISSENSDGRMERTGGWSGAKLGLAKGENISYNSSDISLNHSWRKTE